MGGAKVLVVDDERIMRESLAGWSAMGSTWPQLQAGKRLWKRSETPASTYFCWTSRWRG